MATPEIDRAQGLPRATNNASRQELLDRYLTGQVAAGEAPSSVERVVRKDLLPLSFSQERLWFLDQLRPGGVEYAGLSAWRLVGPLDVGAFRGAWNGVVARHEVLRTRYGVVDGEPVQLIDDRVEVELPVVDLSEVPVVAQERALAEVYEQHAAVSFDLGHELPLRLRLVRLAKDKHVLLLFVHHIAFDGWSVGVLTREVGALYAALVTGVPARLAPLPVQYADFAAWQREQSSGAKMTRQLAYWRDRLAGLEPLELPTDRARPLDYDTRGATLPFTVDHRLGAALTALGRAHRATPFMVLLAAFQVLLARHSGRTDIAVGTPIAGRATAEVENLIGFFVNNVVMRANLSGDLTFGGLLGQVRDTALQAYANQDVPFEHLVNELAPERDLSRNPLFSHMFIMHDNDTAEFTSAGLHARSIPIPSTSAKFDLTLQLVESTDGTLRGVFEYGTALFDPDTVHRLANHYVRLLESITTNPGAKLVELEMLSESERAQLVRGYNDTSAPGSDQTVADLFERQARSTPDAVALICGDAQVTYVELDARANQLARHLRTLGAGPDTLVGVCLDRGTDLVVALLAVLKSGATYVPIDPAYPPQRVEFMLADAGVELVLTQQALRDHLQLQVRHTVRVDQERDRIANYPDQPLRQIAALDDLAYTIYTSGSTGTPKGVMISHRALTNFLLSMLDRPGLRSGVPVIALTTVSFDISALEIYLPLLVGARVVMATTEQAKDPHQMIKLITNTNPAVVQATPVYYQMLLDTGWSPPADLTVLCGGEGLPTELARRLATGGATVWDLYGPTEATVWATTAILDTHGRVTHWAPLTNYTIHILDPHLNPTPTGVPGELHIGGTGIARGYLGQPALTANTFIPDPHTAHLGGRLYRTGDLARRHPNGAVEILGRKDRQTKIRGHRIEPAEIETALRTHDQIHTAIVTPTGQQLTAYVVPREPTQRPTPELLRTHLLRTLPDYMIPTVYIPLTTLPITPNGKIDHNALPHPDDTTPTTSPNHTHQPQRTPTEHTITTIWQDILNTTNIGIHDNFFDIGGHSLLATKVVNRIRATLNIDLPLRALFDHPTIGTLANTLTSYPQQTQRPTLPVLAPRRRTGRGGRR